MFRAFKKRFHPQHMHAWTERARRKWCGGLLLRHGLLSQGHAMHIAVASSSSGSACYRLLPSLPGSIILSFSLVVLPTWDGGWDRSSARHSSSRVHLRQCRGAFTGSRAFPVQIPLQNVTQIILQDENNHVSVTIANILDRTIVNSSLIGSFHGIPRGICRRRVRAGKDTHLQMNSRVRTEEVIGRKEAWLFLQLTAQYGWNRILRSIQL
jgi:hypothetical protein